MSTIGPNPPPSGPPPRPVPFWKQPVVYLVGQVAGEFRGEATEDKIQQVVQSLDRETEGMPSFLAPIAKFLAKRNILELGGAGAAINGLGAWIISMIGVDRLFKWGGILLLAVGAVAAVAGKILGMNFTPKQEPPQAEARHNGDDHDGDGRDRDLEPQPLS